MQNRNDGTHARSSFKTGTMIQALSILCVTLATVPFIASTAAAKETLKFAYLADPSREAILWAFKNGKVTSDKIALETNDMSVPALTQAMSSRQYDVVEVSPFAIPAGTQRGLNLTIIGGGLRHADSSPGFELWVKADGPIKKTEDLIGKQVALYSLRSVLAAVVYSAFSDGMKMDLKKFEFVQMPPPAMPAALSTGRVAAASLIQAQSYQALKTGDYKPLISAGQVFKKANGVTIPSSVIASYPEKLKKNPALYHEFLRVLRESRDYAIAHPQEVFPAVGKAVNVEPGFFTWWFQNYEFGYTIDADALKALDLFWGLAQKNKWIERYSPARSTVWDAIIARSK